MSYFYTTAEANNFFTDIAEANELCFHQVFDIDPYTYRGEFIKANDIKGKTVSFNIPTANLTAETMSRVWDLVENAFRKEDKL